MKAIDFISKDLKAGDKVRLTMKNSATPLTGIFGGYKTFGLIETDLNFGLWPVFYREARNGGTHRRSIFGDGRLTWCAVREIEDVEKVTAKYRHLGYYNNWKDCHNLGIRGAEACLKAYRENYGAFYEVDNDEEFDDIDSADDDTTYLEGGKYAVVISGCDPANITEEDIASDRDCVCYIDIFERVDKQN